MQDTSAPVTTTEVQDLLRAILRSTSAGRATGVTPSAALRVALWGCDAARAA